LFGDPANNRAGIEQFNQIIWETAAAHQISAVDVYAVSQGMNTDANLIVADGLHPAAAEYTAWVDRIYSVALDQLGK
jgi:lysophospholipase L1-like esterase